MRAEERTDRRPAWTPRLSSAFQHHLQSTLTAQGRRAWSDRTIIRILAHLKTFAKWVHALRPFPLGNPMGDGKDSSQILTDRCMRGISASLLAGSKRRYCSKGSGMRLGFKGV
jgi:hypothetical protein